jgi:DNA replication protein DnaC
MLAHPTYDRLNALGLAGMAKAFDEQRRSPDLAALSFEERVGIMADREAAERDTKRMVARLKFAALRQNACVEDIDLKTPRGIDRTLLARLVAGDWIDQRQNCLITGPCGVGKSWLACTLGHKACRDGRSVFYQRVPRLFEALALVRGDGRHARMLKGLARIELLILDDWGLSVLTQAQRIDLLEILEDRNGRGSTIVTSQIPVDQWHEVIADPTLVLTLASTASFTTPTASRSPETACEGSLANGPLTPDKTPDPIAMSVKPPDRPRSRGIAAHTQWNAQVTSQRKLRDTSQQNSRLTVLEVLEPDPRNRLHAGHPPPPPAPGRGNQNHC